MNQENSLFDDGFVCNGTKSIDLDNLSHIYVQKYIKEWDGHSICEITDLDFLVDENYNIVDTSLAETNLRRTLLSQTDKSVFLCDNSTAFAKSVVPDVNNIMSVASLSITLL